MEDFVDSICYNGLSRSESRSDRSGLKRKAEGLSRSYCEVFSMLTSANFFNAESSKLLEVITNVRHLYILLHIWLLKCPDFLFWQLNFTPADIPHASLKTMAKNVSDL